jgi:hypothetical protein
MKRRAFKLLLFLLAGAIINVAVAWVCVSMVQLEGLDEEPSIEAQQLFQQLKDPCGPEQNGQISQTVRTGFGVKQSIITVRCYGGGCFPYELTAPARATLAAGWPMNGLRGSVDADYGIWNRENCWRSPLYEESSFLSSNEDWRDLPIGVTAGFAFNTIFYAAIVWLLFFVPGAIRKRVRRKRGQCAACGYSLRESVSEKCPECGAMITQNRARQEAAT